MCNVSHASIDYTDQYQFEYKWPVKKSWRQIIKEVIKKKKARAVFPQNTIPIPLYDGMDLDKLKNIA